MKRWTTVEKYIRPRIARWDMMNAVILADTPDYDKLYDKRDRTTDPEFRYKLDQQLDAINNTCLILTARMDAITEEIGDYIFSCCTKAGDSITVNITKPKNYAGDPDAEERIMRCITDLYDPAKHSDLISDEDNVKFTKQIIGVAIIDLYKEEIKRREEVKEND